MKRVGCAWAAFLCAAALRADEIFLRSGGSISGEIVERSPTSVTVDIGAGTMAVELAYVDRIESGPSALGEYRERAARIAPGDVEAWRELGRWAEARGLSGQAHDAYLQVLVDVPGDPEANQAIGRVLLDGRWVSEEESYLARGFVEFEGEWVTPEERRLMLEERAELERYDREVLDAQLRADQEAARAREAEEAETWNQAPAEVGYPVYWGWGPGPGVWPSRPGQRPGNPRPAPRPARPRG